MAPRDPFEPDGRDHKCKDCMQVFDCRGKLLAHRARSHEQASQPEEVPAS
jgi:hypothetical protein